MLVVLLAPCRKKRFAFDKLPRKCVFTIYSVVYGPCRAPTYDLLGEFVLALSPKSASLSESLEGVLLLLRRQGGPVSGSISASAHIVRVFGLSPCDSHRWNLIVCSLSCIRGLLIRRRTHARPPFSCDPDGCRSHPDCRRLAHCACPRASTELGVRGHIVAPQAHVAPSRKRPKSREDSGSIFYTAFQRPIVVGVFRAREGVVGCS